MHGRIGMSALLFGVLTLTLIAGRASAQSADLVSTVSASPVLSVEDAAALVGIAGGSLPTLTEPSAAVEKLRAVGFAVPARSGDSPITIGEYCWLVVQILDLPHGLLYTIFPGPRYAVRELESRGLVPAGTHPGARLSGNEALRILGMAMRDREPQ